MDLLPNIATHLRRVPAFAALLACLALASPTPASAAPCPNEAFRAEQGATNLPDCMALEMVSPPNKALQPAFQPSFSLDGERVLFRSVGALAGTTGIQIFNGDHYIATRTASGWVTAPTSPPSSAEIFAGGRFGGGPYAFSPDLSGWVLSGATQSQAQVGKARFFRGGLDGSFAPLSPLLVPTDDSGSQYLQFSYLSLTGTATSTDLSTTVFRVFKSSISLLPGDPRGNSILTEEPGDDRNSYVAFLDEQGEPAFELLARDGSGTVYGGRCGAHTGGGGNSEFAPIYQGAISADGSRILFTTRPTQEWDEAKAEGPVCDTDNPLRILERVQTPAGPQISEIAPGGPPAGDDLYQGASEDGTKVFFTTPRKLAVSDLDPNSEACDKTLGKSSGCDLYLYDSSKPPAERLTQVSAGEAGSPTPGEGAGVLSSIAAISKDGTHAYFAAQGVLTTDPNPEGELPVAGQPNLYLYERDAGHPTGDVAFIGTLAASDKGRLWGAEGSYFGGAYAGAQVFAFASDAQLTSDDSDGAHRDVFRYDAVAGTLQRISKAVPGGADNGPFDVAVNPSSPANGDLASNFGEKARWVSEDGETVAFATSEALDPADEDGLANPYLWKGGDLAGVRAQAGDPPSVSPDGREVGFSTPDPLVAQDIDTARDVYALRPGGGFPPPKAAVSCNPLKEGSCQGAVGPQPGPLVNATVGFVSSGNQSKPPRCRKGLVKRRGKCRKPRKEHRQRKRAHNGRGDRG